MSGQGTTNVDVQWNNDAGPVTLIAKTYLCGDSLVATLPLTLTAAPPPNILVSGLLCPGDSVELDAGPGYST